jgi:hypothetical protein
MKSIFKNLLAICIFLPAFSLIAIPQNVPVEMAKVGEEDIVENFTFSQSVKINFSGNTAEVSTLPLGVTINKSGSKVDVNSEIEGLELVVTGNSSNGLLRINSTNKIKLTLNGVTLTNSNGPAINILSGKRTFIVLNSGTNNVLVDGKSYNAENESAKGTLFTEGELIISGKGRLTVTGNKGHAICADDYVVIREGTISIPSAVNDGIHSNDFILVENGTLNITSIKDGLDCELGGLRINNGTVKIETTGSSTAAIKSETITTITGGKINISVSGAASKGIRGKGGVTISGGAIDIQTKGGALLENNNISSAAGVSSNGNVNISGTTTNLTIASSGSAGKGISCDGTLEITNGTIKITTTGQTFYGGTSSRSQQYYGRGGFGGGNSGSTAKGIKAEGDLTIRGGNITVTTGPESNSEAIESKRRFIVYGGTIKATAYDDAINAVEMIINGGEIYALSMNNDGMDSNGPVTISGGLIVTAAARGGMEGGIDCDRYPISIKGGTVLSFGGTGSSPSATSSTKPSIVYYGRLNQNIRIVGPDNKELITVKMPIASSESLTFTSPSLKTNSTYTLLTGGTISGGKDTNGIVTGSTYSNGTELAKITVNSLVNISGSSSGGYGFPGGGRRGF